MGDMYIILAFVGLILWGAAMAGTILHDVHRHNPAPMARPAPHTGTTPNGVPYVHGPTVTETERDATRQSGMLPEAVHAPQLRDRLVEPVAAAVAP